MATLDLKLGGGSDRTAFAVVTYDPTNEIIQPDGTADLTDCDVSQVAITVTSGPVTIHLWRKQGNSKTPWQSGTFGVGIYIFHAGGPVKTFGDIASWQVVT